MKNTHKHEIPIKSKIEMCNDIAKIIQHLHKGEQSQSEPLIKDLKVRSLFLDDTIQNDVLIFAEQVQFQYAYDPWHKVTPEVQKAADRLIEDLGFQPQISQSLRKFLESINN